MKSHAYEQEFLAHELNEWAKLVDERLKAQLDKKGIGISESLRRSLAYRIAAFGFKGKYSGIFNESGRMVDMGAGRKPKGLQSEANKLATIERAKGGKRHAKKWYSKTMYGMLNNLIYRIANNYSDFVVNTIGELDKTK